MIWHLESNRDGRGIRVKKEIPEQMRCTACKDMGRLGVTKEKDGIVFRAAFDETEEIFLLLYKKGSDEIVNEISMSEWRQIGNVYAVKMENLDDRKYEYNYRVGNKVIQDPYAGVIRGRNVFGEQVADEDGHQIRCGFDFEAYDWKEDEPLQIPYEDAVMYSLHVRGFTMQANSKVRYKGTFRGVAEKAAYLRDLGINQVKLMPAYEFDEIIKCYTGRYMSYEEEGKNTKLNFWGYGEGWYFAPKASYASGSDPVKEMKDMISVLHQNGIEVLMEFYFTKDINVRMVTDCLTHWITDYHVDGFHLPGNDAMISMLAKDPVFAGTKLLGSSFSTEEIYSNGKLPSRRNLAAATAASVS